MPQALEPMAMYALFPEPANDALYDALLLHAMWRDELLVEPITAHLSRIGAEGEDRPLRIVEGTARALSSQRSEPGDKDVLERCHSRPRFAAPGQLPSQQFAAVEIELQRQHRPVFPAPPDAEHVGHPAFIRALNHGRQAQYL